VKVGDLVKIKYDGVVALITKVETVQVPLSPYKATWIHLLNQPVSFKVQQLEVINANR
jgi:hypothetical protein